ncbi:hypothetical protein BU17DRAFT_70779 [Hysterangium stoloniferum]|nr:hypothetical protein BU17DRAFT_70779 [Hysterangium stoloniferum]
MDYDLPAAWEEPSPEWDSGIMGHSPYHPQHIYSTPQTEPHSQIEYSSSIYDHTSPTYATLPQPRLISMPIHGYHPQYAPPVSIQDVPPSYVSTGSNVSMGQHSAQFTGYAHHNQFPYHDDSGNQAAPDAIHSYRRLTAAEEEASAYTNDSGSPSNRRRSGSQSSARPQVPAKFECVAWLSGFDVQFAIRSSPGWTIETGTSVGVKQGSDCRVLNNCPGRSPGSSFMCQ